MQEKSNRPPGGCEGGRQIAVTGVTRGLGRALAERFAALGHRVAGCGRDTAALAELTRPNGSRWRRPTSWASGPTTTAARSASRSIDPLTPQGRGGQG